MSTLTGLIGGGGGGKVFYRTFIFTSSGTYTPSADCEAFVYVIGAGGSGAAYVGFDNDRHCSGGGAGGLCASILNVASGVNYTATIGTGGAGKSPTTGNGLDGSAGGSSSFSGTGITTMTANGGGAGDFAFDAGSSVGATGGSATGGNLFNYTGGGSGDVSSGASAQASGGGSVNLFDAVNAVTSNNANNTTNVTPAKDPFSGTNVPNYYRQGTVADSILAAAIGGQQGEAFWGTDGNTSGTTALYGGGSGGLVATSGSSGSGGNGFILVLELR